MSSGFKAIEMEVNGSKVSINLDDELEISNLSRDMDQVAAKMAYWGAVWAAAESEQERVDAFYRKWRAEAGQALLAANDKSAEWKVRQDIEGDEKFYKLKTSYAKAVHNTTLAKSIYESFKTKANLLQSKGAMARAELDATGMTTKRTAKEDRATAEREERDSAMRALNQKKRSKTIGGE